MPAKTPWWFWVIAAVSLLWNLMGAMDYTLTHLRVESYLAAFSEEEKAYFFGFPAWAVAFWALGVWGCLAGSLLLLARSRWAVIAFAVSTLGLVGTTIYQYSSDAPSSLNTSAAVIFSIAIWIATLGLLWFALAMRRRGILR